MLKFNQKEWLLLVLFITLLVFPLQYLCRSLDMSTLTSWRWVFDGNGPASIFLFLLFAVLFALPLSFSDVPEKHPAAFLYILSVLCILPFINSPEYLLDSGRYFLQAKYLAEHGISEYFLQWGKEITSWTDLPLVPLIYGMLFKLFGESKLPIALFNTLMFGFIPLLVYGIGRQLWHESTGFYGGLLILASPYLHTQVPLMLVDVHTMFFLLLAVFTFTYALEKDNLYLSLAAAASITLALFSKYSTWPMLGVLVVITLVRINFLRPVPVLKRIMAVTIMTGILLGIVFYWKGPLILEQIDFLRTYQLAGLKKWQEGYVAALFFQAHPYIILAALLGFYRAAIRLDRKILIIAWFGCLAFFLELKRLRYLLPVLPFLTLTAAYGLQFIPHARVKRYIVYCSILTSVVISVWIYKPFLASTSMSNLQRAGRFLNSLPTEAVEVYCLPQVNSLGNTVVAVPILDLYTDKIIYQAQPWNTVEGLQRAKEVSLRFTWELSQPAYYRDGKYIDAKLPLVIISPEPVSRIPLQLGNSYPARHLLKKFTRTTGIFRYQIFVSVFTAN